MAEQQGLLTYSGKLGETVGYRRGGKHFERAKPRSYQPGEESLKSGAEFGTGSTGCALLKMAFEPLLLRAFSEDLHNRLAGKLRVIIRTGPVAKKGKRGVFDGNVNLLKGFEFNSKVSFRKLTQMTMSTTVTAEEVKVSIRPFKWNGTIQAPAQAQRVKIGFCCVFADFNSGSFTALRADDLQIERNKDFQGGRFKIAIPNNEELAVLLVMNIFFESDSGNRAYRVENKKYQAGIILDAVHIKNGEVVEFVTEELPKKEEEPQKPPDAYWELGWEEEEE
jgi:hypothetical protein